MTYYEILQVSENASGEVIRMAYKALAKKYHPDVFDGDLQIAELKMKQINEAYEILADPQKRKEYDSFLHTKKGENSHYNCEPKSKKEKKSNNNTAKHSNSTKNILIIVALLFVVFAQAAHPYIESSEEFLYDNALILGARDFSLTTLIMGLLPILIGIVKKNLSIKNIRIICGINSSGIFFLSILLYVFGILPTISVGWIVALIYYFINVLSLRQICFKYMKNPRKIIIIVASIMGTLLIIFFAVTAYFNSILRTDTDDNSQSGNFVIDYDEYYVNVRCFTITPENYDSDHSWDDAKITAEFIMAEWQNGVATEQSMISVMKKYGSDQGGGRLLPVERGDFVEELDEWCFDRNRKVGDAAIVENVYGYTIIYFSGVVEIKD